MTTQEALAFLHLEPESTYTTREIATRLAYETRHVVYEALRHGHITPIKPGRGRIVFSGEAVAEWAVKTGRIDLIQRVLQQFVGEQASA